MRKALIRGAMAIAGLLASGISQAAMIVGGSSLLTSGYANQLETWLGEGSISLTNIYTKQAGDTSTTFHNAVDGKGRTIVVMYGTDITTGTSAIFGGYNPQSWNSFSAYNLTPVIADRTAFLFNLSDALLYRQRTTAFTGGPYVGFDAGLYQSYNYLSYGPSFGGGLDILVDSSLNSGQSFLYSYNPNNAMGTGISIVNGGVYPAIGFRLGGIEVFTISDAVAVPEPQSIPLVLLALGAGVMSMRRRSI